MTTSAFGRRVTPPGAAAPRRPDPPHAAEDDPRLEALRREMAKTHGEDVASRGWRRDQELGRWLSWFATFALLMPGVICFMAHAPPAVSGVLELTGLVGGFVLRRARTRRLAAIRAWAPDEFA